MPEKTTHPDNDPESMAHLFDSIANRYDLLNHLLSFGLDLHWRRKTLQLTKTEPNQAVLDLCCGTGDMALCFARSRDNLRVTGCDISRDMITLANKKARRLAHKGKVDTSRIDWLTGDCTAIDLADASFDVVSCAFGLRSVRTLRSALKEAHRLLKPNGKICILEFSLPKKWFIRWPYLCYLRWIAPAVGYALTRRFGAYRYLAESIEYWHKNIDLGEQLTAAGFDDVRSHKLSAGIVEICVAHKAN